MYATYRPVATSQPAVPQKEIWCYVRSSFTVVRMVIDVVFVLFAVIYSAYNGWPRPWKMSSELLWRNSHIALVIFEVGIHPPEFSLSHVVCLERLHLFVYRALTLWSMAADAGVITDAALDLHHHDESQYAEKLAIACVVAAMSLWRFMEVFAFLSPMKVEKTTHFGPPSQS